MPGYFCTDVYVCLCVFWPVGMCNLCMYVYMYVSRQIDEYIGNQIHRLQKYD